MSRTTVLPEAPTVRVTRTLEAPLDRAFGTFVDRMDSWWPRAYSLLPEGRAGLTLEQREGGRWYERGPDGSECDWGRVLVWDPPNRVVLSWQIGVGFQPQADPERASRVEVRFEAEGRERTTITLIHADFERHGDGWESMRESVAGEHGWAGIIEAYAESAKSRHGSVGASVSVQVARRFRASAEEVFDAWLRPEMIGRWMFGPAVREEEIVALSIDARVGGSYSFVVRRDGLEIDHVGRYIDIQRPRRLVFTWGIAGESEDESHVTVEVTPSDAGCELVLTHELHPDWAEYADRTRKAWERMLAQLDRTTSSPPGTFTEPGTVRFERLLPGPIERVWAYLTEPDKRATWLAAGPMELEVGGRVELRFKHSELSREEDEIPEKYRQFGDETSFTGRVTQCYPPRLLSYTWAESWGDDSEATFELTPEGDHVRLVLVHRRLRTRDDVVSVASGWHTHLGILADRLAEREPPGFWSVHNRIEAEYEQLIPA